MNKSEMMAKIGISKIAFNDWGLKLIYFTNGGVRLYSGVSDRMICKALINAQSIKEPDWFVRRLFDADNNDITKQTRTCKTCKHCACTYGEVFEDDAVYCCTLICADTELDDTCEKWEKRS